MTRRPKYRRAHRPQNTRNCELSGEDTEDDDIPAFDDEDYGVEDVRALICLG